MNHCRKCDSMIENEKLAFQTSIRMCFLNGDGELTFRQSCVDLLRSFLGNPSPSHQLICCGRKYNSDTLIDMNFPTKRCLFIMQMCLEFKFLCNCHPRPETIKYSIW